MEEGELDEVDKLKTKILTAWHNVKYSWHVKTKTSFSRNSPVFLLGKCYHFKSDVLDGEKLDGEKPDREMPDREMPDGATVDGAMVDGAKADGAMVDGAMVDGAKADGATPGKLSGACVPCNVEQFRRDFGSRIWLTYRRAFPPLGAVGLTTDCGWGCTLRSGQMLLAQSLLLHFLGRHWVWADVLDTDNQDSPGLKTGKQGTLERSEGLYRSLVGFSGSLKLSRNTCDDPGSEHRGQVQSPALSQDEICHRKIISWFADIPQAPFGMHRLTEVGKSSGKKAGDWYGPAVVAHITRKALQEAQEPELQGLAVYVAQDSTVYLADVMERRSVGAVILLIPVRLGGEKVNSQYQDIIKGVLSLEFCIGIMGGKPKQSLYFVGFQDDSLIYLDPHCCQPFVDVTPSDFPIQSFHCLSPKKMPFSKMDPSCTIGFYCGSNTELSKVKEEISKVLSSPASPDGYPLFSFSPGHARDQQVAALGTWGPDTGLQTPAPQQHRDSQEFVLL